jgi:hypothetical protein
MQGASRVLSTAFHGAYLMLSPLRSHQPYIAGRPICFGRLSQTSRLQTCPVKELHSLTLGSQTTRFTESLGLSLKLRFPTRLDGCTAKWDQPSTKKHWQYEVNYTEGHGCFR